MIMREKENFLKKLILLLIFLFGTFSFAQEVEYPKIPGVPTPTATTTFPEYVRYLFNFFVLISGIVALGVLIWAGILWLTSAGNPIQAGSAKRKAAGATFGLVLLFSSYLLITTINPNLSILKGPEKLTPKSGVYLIKGDYKCYFWNNASTTVPHCSTTTFDQIEFISPTSSLLEVYVYDKEGFGGTKERIKNPGAGATSSIPDSISQVKSIWFLWRIPGLYLYDGTSSEYSLINFPYPGYVGNTTVNLGEWNDKINQIRIVDPSNEVHYGAVVFSDKLDGKCAIIRTSTTTCNEGLVKDVSVDTWPGEPLFCGIYNNYGGIRDNEISSILIFPIDLSSSPFGKVKFYDKEECEGNKLEVTVTSSKPIVMSFISFCYPDPSICVGSPPETWYGKVNSFEIDGNFEVVLFASTSPVMCQADWENMRPPGTRCVTKLEGSSVYPENSTNTIKNFIIVPK
jgi:hypothetical protein